MSSTIRFPQLNLWRNPFGEFSDVERSQLACCELESEIQWLRETPGRGLRILQFIGPCGHGKTSHLHFLSKFFRDAIYLYIPPEKTVPPWKDCKSIIVDELDRAPWWTRRQMIRSRRILAVGTHRDLTSLFRRAGIEARTITVSNRGDVSRVERIMNLRIQASIFDRGRPAPRVTRQEAEMLVHQFGDDLRAIEDKLYENYQTRTAL